MIFSPELLGRFGNGTQQYQQLPCPANFCAEALAAGLGRQPVLLRRDVIGTTRNFTFSFENYCLWGHFFFFNGFLE